jgi:hypothetical protein
MLSIQNIMNAVKEKFTGKLTSDGRIPGQRINLVAEEIVNAVNGELADVWSAIQEMKSDSRRITTEKPLTQEAEPVKEEVKDGLDNQPASGAGLETNPEAVR